MTATTIDRLAVSFSEKTAPVRDLFAGLFKHIGTPEYHIGHGAHGFQNAAVVTVGGAQVGWWAWGGASQRGRSYVDLSGVGCQLVRDWPSAQQAIEALPAVKTRRIDIALDRYYGELRYEDVVAAYHGGKFRRGIRPPKHRQIIGDDEDGRTLYVGTRGNDVFFRCYEKGKKELGGRLASREVMVVGNGDYGLPFKFRDWLRLELELRAVSRPLSLDVIAERDQYFAGAYPYLQEVLPDVEPQIMVTPQQVAEANLRRSLAIVRQQWGSTLHTALTVYEGDVFAVWKQICGNEHNERLVRAGALLPVAEEVER